MRIYIKLVDYLGEYLCDFGIGKRFLSTQKATSIKLKIGKMDFIKIEAFLTSKPTNSEVKGKLYIVRKHSQRISDKEFISKIHKELLQINNKRQ